MSGFFGLIFNFLRLTVSAVVLSSLMIFTYFYFSRDNISRPRFEDGAAVIVPSPEGWCKFDKSFVGFFITRYLDYEGINSLRYITKGECSFFSTIINVEKGDYITLMAQNFQGDYIRKAGCGEGGKQYDIGKYVANKKAFMCRFIEDQTEPMISIMLPLPGKKTLVIGATEAIYNRNINDITYIINNVTAE